MSVVLLFVDAVIAALVKYLFYATLVSTLTPHTIPTSFSLHKLSPSSLSGDIDRTDRLVVDLSPLRLPGEFAMVERELKERVLAKFDVHASGDKDYLDEDAIILDNGNADDDDDGWETRPIYQLQPHSLSWSVSRQAGKEIGKFLGTTFDTVEKGSTSAKPKGVKPGKGRRHGGYGIG